MTLALLTDFAQSGPLDAKIIGCPGGVWAG